MPIRARVSILDPVFLRPDPKWRSKQILACANGIYPGVRDFIVYFGGHLHVIKAPYTEYVKIY